MAILSPPVDQVPSNRRPITKSIKLVHLSLLAALLIPLAGFAEEFIGERTRLTTLLLYVPQHPLLIPPLLLLIQAVRHRQGKLVALNLLTCLITLVWLMGFNIPLRLPSTSSPTIRVMTYNSRFSGFGTQKVAKAILSQQPNIVCLQEATTELRDNPPPVTDGTWYTYQHLPGWRMVRAGDVATLTRWPILSKRTYRMPPPNNRILLETKIKTPQGVITVFNAHIGTASRYAVPSTTYSGRLANIIRHSRASAEARRKHLPAIDTAVAQCRTPYIIVGDFNNPPRGYFHRHLTRQFTDAFAKSGWGFGYTFPARVPLMRIDYIWLGPAVAVKKCFVPRLYTSDHRPLIADISFKQRQ